MKTAMTIFLFATAILGVHTLNAQEVGVKYMPGSSDPTWMSLEELFDRKDGISISNQVTFTHGVTYMREEGLDCLDLIVETSASAEAKSMSIEDLMGKAITVFEAEVTGAVPGILKVDPGTLLVLEVTDVWKGIEREAQLRYVYPSFEAALPSGDRLCYRDGVPRVPKVGDRVVLARSSHAQRHEDWMISHPEDLFVVLSKGEVDAGLLHSAKLGERRDQKATTDWLRGLLARMDGE